MQIRYFFITDKDNQPLTLLRLRVDDIAEELYEEEWHEGWQESERLWRYITDGDSRLIEITEPEARKAFPSAFIGLAVMELQTEEAKSEF